MLTPLYGGVLKVLTVLPGCSVVSVQIQKCHADMTQWRSEHCWFEAFWGSASRGTGPGRARSGRWYPAQAGLESSVVGRVAHRHRQVGLRLVAGADQFQVRPAGRCVLPPFPVPNSEVGRS
jgi:hypothetical protein